MVEKLNRLGILILMALIANTLMGCATGTRIVEINAGVKAKKNVISTEKRQTNLVKTNVVLDFTPTLTGNMLNLRLQSQDHYGLQSRSIVQHKSTGAMAGASGGMAILSLGTGIYIASLAENGTIDQDLGYIAMGVGALDVLLYYIVDNTYTSEKRTQWQTVGTVPRAPKPIPNHPVTLTFPLFGHQDIYYTNAAGEITVSAIELISNISNLAPVLHTDLIEIDASTTVNGEEKQISLAVARFSNGRYDPLFAIFREQAELRQEKPADLVTEITFSDRDDFIPNNALDAGEQKGELAITVKNKGEGPGIDLQLHLSSDNSDIQFQRTQALGTIEPDNQKKVVVPMQTNLQTTDGVANILVEVKEKRGYDAQKQRHRIRVAGLKPPRLMITAVEVNDKTLGNAIGNGNGIPENDETIELNVFIKNEGVGDALGTQLELVSLNRGLDIQVRSASIGTIRPDQTVKGILRFRIPRTFEAETLNYKLRVTEVRGADSIEKTDMLPMRTQRPILAYHISPPTSITNGTSAAFTITPRNIGKLRARDVLLKLSARNVTIVPSTVNLGTLEADGSLQPQPFTVTLPRTFKASQLSLNVRFSQAEFDEFSQTENYPVKHIEPHLEIAERLVADANGDGKIQQGERVEFEVTVTNKGKLDALNAQMQVSVADARIRIDTPNRPLGRLAPNYTSSPERFAFTIPRAVPAGQLPVTVKATHRDFPSVERTLAYTVHAEAVVTTTETPTQRTRQPQIPRSVANKPPVIVLRNNLSDTQTLYSPNFTLPVSVSDDQGLDIVRVVHDGVVRYDSQSAPDAARQLQASNRRLLSFDVRMNLQEGENKIIITGRDNNNEQTSLTISRTYERRTSVIGLEAPYSDVDVDIPQGREKNPDAVALVIGIGEYREGEVTDATFADRDAIAFKEYLVTTFGFSDDRVFLLTNERATYRDIDRHLRRIERQLTPERRSDVVVFYAGHGTFDLKNNQASHYLVSYDADPNYPEDGYPLDAFYEHLAQLEARSVTVFIDACFSGTDREAGAIVTGTRSLMLPEIQLPRVPVPVLASSTNNQISFSYKPQRHGLFTYYLLKGMRGEADGADGSRKDRNITLSELEAYTREHVSKTADRELGRPQQTTLTGSGKGRVVLKLR